MPSSMKPIAIEAPGGGLVRNTDPRHVPERAWFNGRNVRFPTGGMRVQKTDGYTRFLTSDPPEYLRALWWYASSAATDPHTLVRIGLSGAWRGEGAGGVLIDTQAPAATPADVVTVDQFKETLIWADGKRTMAWGGGDTLAAPIAQAPVGKIVEIHKGHLLVANLTVLQQPWMLMYSAVGDPFNFTDDDAGHQEFLEDSTEIVAVKVLGDHAIVHKPNRLFRFIFVGPPDQYIVEGIPADDGAVSARAPISIGSYQYYPGRTNFYRLGSYSEPIGDAIWPEIEDAIDWPRAHLVYAYRRLEHDEICWKIPTRGTEQPDVTAVYNFRDQTWSLTDHDPGTCFTEIPPVGLHPDEPPSFTPSPTSVRALFGQADGKIQLFGGHSADGVAIHSWLDSRHFTEGLLPARVLAVPVWATGTGTLRITCRAAMDPRTPMPPWPTARLLSLDAPQFRPWVDVRQYGRLWQIRLESTGLNDDWEIAAYGSAIISGGYAR